MLSVDSILGHVGRRPGPSGPPRSGMSGPSGPPRSGMSGPSGPPRSGMSGPSGPSGPPRSGMSGPSGPPRNGISGVRGEPAVDSSFASFAREPGQPTGGEGTGPLARWLAGRGFRRVRLIVTGAGQEGPLDGSLTGRELGRVSRAELCRLVVLADRELRPPEHHPARAAAPVSVPPVGSVDLAVDAPGRPSTSWRGASPGASVWPRTTPPG
jgi:hypothetical protein